jgi:hypothetical protein
VAAAWHGGRGPARALLAALALAALAGCRSGAPRSAVVGVSVAEGLPASRLAELGIGPEDLRLAALRSLAALPGFEAPSAEPPRGARLFRATVALLEARLVRRPVADGPAESAVSRWEVLLDLDLAPPGESSSARDTARWAEAVREGEDPRAALRRAIDGAARKAAASLALALAEAEKPDAQVIADLESGDARVRDFAVRVLADRRNPAAVAPLVARLRDPDPDVVDRAVGALAQIRDPRAVEPLIDLTRRREGPYVAQLVRIIGDIGGPEAEAFLQTMAAGHPEPAVRQAAREALAELRRFGRTGPAGR